MPRRTMEAEIADQATGCREVTPRGQLYLRGGFKVTDEEARKAFCEGETIEDPNAGAGSYRNFLERMGISGTIDVFDQTASSGDWTLLVEVMDTEWAMIIQANRYPYHGFRYTKMAEHYLGTLEDVREEIAAEVGG